MADISISTQDELPGPEGDEPYVMFVNQPEYRIRRLVRTNVFMPRSNPNCSHLILTSRVLTKAAMHDLLRQLSCICHCDYAESFHDYLCAPGRGWIRQNARRQGWVISDGT